jgi:SAM-dependent methyltransferase
MSYLGKHAEYYDLLYKNKPYQEEATYVADLIQQRSPDAQTILDLGCGTGLRSLEMARLGYQICGLDQSPAMLSIARQHLAAAKDIPPTLVEFVAGDITNFSAKRKYDAIISLFHVFSYLTTMDSLQAAAACSFTSLKAGGVLLFDYWHGPGVLKDPPVTRQRHIENSAVSIVRTSVPRHLADRHLVELSLSLDITEKSADILEHVEETYLLRYWFPEELTEQLENSGFQHIRHYAWLTQQAPGPEHWQACTVATRP